MNPTFATIFAELLKDLTPEQYNRRNFDDQNRTRGNAEVLYELMMFMKRFPSLRFTQALACLKIDPEKQFNEEPQVTLARIRNSDINTGN